MKRAYADIREGQIHYITAGAGKPLLLLHQTPSSSDEYAEIVPELARECRVIAMDSLGYGMSDPPPRVFEIGDYARTVIEFLDALHVGRTSLLGHHTGATIALEVAAAYPDRVDRLILSACPYYDGEVRRSRLQDTRFKPLPIAADGAYLEERWHKLLIDAAHSSPQARHKAVIANLLPARQDKAAYQAVFRYDEQARLPFIKCPTLLMCGSEDLFFGKLVATAGLIPNCITRVIEGGDGLTTLTRSEEFARHVREFLAA